MKHAQSIDRVSRDLARGTGSVHGYDPGCRRDHTTRTVRGARCARCSQGKHGAARERGSGVLP